MLSNESGMAGIYDRGLGSGIDSPPSGIIIKIDEINKAISVLNDSIETLANRISPIIRPVPAEENIKDPGPTSPGSNLYNELLAIESRISYAIGGLTELRSNVDL